MLRPITIGLWVLALATGVLAFRLHASSQQPPAEQKPAGEARLAIKFDEPIAVEATSKPVHWQGHPYQLVGFHQVVFHREANRLTAKLGGSVTTFDDVDYRVSLAVFDDAGQLLGAATATCEVQRVWKGFVLTRERTLEFDFDVSQAFERAASFSIAIAERKVLTPDDWQKK